MRQVLFGKRLPSGYEAFALLYGVAAALLGFSVGEVVARVSYALVPLDDGSPGMLGAALAFIVLWRVLTWYSKLSMLNINRLSFGAAFFFCGVHYLQVDPLSVQAMLVTLAGLLCCIRFFASGPEPGGWM